MMMIRIRRIISVLRVMVSYVYSLCYVHCYCCLIINSLIIRIVFLRVLLIVLLRRLRLILIVFLLISCVSSHYYSS